MRSTTSVGSLPRSRGWIRSLSADPLAQNGHRTPHPIAVAVFATALGIGFLGLFRYGRRFGFELPMFEKEGFAENLTFLLELWGAVLCALAAKHMVSVARARATLLRFAFAACALALFVVAMEEISWGQQLLGFSTPESLKAVNLQQETTLHNLADRDTLTHAWKIAGVVFAAGVLGLILSSWLTDDEFLDWIAPHPSLAPLALITGYAAAAVHPELAELLMSMFFAFYAYRIYVASEPASRGTS